MASQAGVKFLLKTPLDDTISKQAVKPDLTDFSVIGGFQSNSADLSATEIETTNKSSDENRELLNKQGLLSLSASGSGVLQNSIIAKALEVNFLAQDLRWFVLEREDGRSWIAKFKMTAYNFSGNHDGAVSFTVSLMSSSALYIEDTSGFAYDTVSDRITAFDNQAASLRYRPFLSADYALANIPAPAARAAAFVARVRAEIGNAAEATALPATDISINGPAAANMYAFPIIAIRTADIGTRILQALDALDQVIDLQPIPDGGNAFVVGAVEYKAYFINQALTMGESTDIKIQAG